MPEGDTLFRAARALHRALAGEQVVRFETVYARLARVDATRPVAGRTVEAAEAVGKHLLLRLSGGLVLRTHMRMSGSWHLYRPGERWRRPRHAMRIVLETTPFVAVAFDVPDAEWIEERSLARHRGLARLGPDLLSPAFDAAEAARRIRAAGDREIGEVLLDQAVMAGAGNVFKSEILFVAGVSPFRRASALGDGEVEAIVAVARAQLAENVREGSRDAARRTTGRDHPGERLWVYGRAGAPCRRCGAAIRRRRQGVDARATYWCPACQAGEGEGA